MPKVIEDFEREPHGVVDPIVQNMDVEDVESSPQISIESDDSKLSQQSTEESTTADIGGNNSTNITILEVKEDVGQSYPHDTVTEVREELGGSISPAFMILPVTEVREEGGQPHGTATEVNLSTSASEGPSGQPDFPVDTSGQRLPNTNLEDLEPDTFRKEMQETGKKEDLKELSDKILYNQTRGDNDEEQAVCSTDSGGDLPNVVTETIEAVTDLAEVFFKSCRRQIVLVRDYSRV